MGFMTPLRWKIAAGYLIFAIVTALLWKELATGWSFVMTLLAPVFAFFAALIALKFGVVLTALGTFLLVFLSSALNIIIGVSKMGIIKGLFLPWLLAGLHWLHRKSEFLQIWVERIYTKAKSWGQSVFEWWQARNKLDRILLLGFLGPLIIVVVFTLLLKRFVYMFISKKAAEQVVQRATKATVKNFHKIPVIGDVSNRVKEKASSLKTQGNSKLRQIDNVPEAFETDVTVADQRKPDQTESGDSKISKPEENSKPEDQGKR